MRLDLIRYGGYLIGWVRFASHAPIPIALPIRQVLYLVENGLRASSLVESSVKTKIFQKMKTAVFSKPPKNFKTDRYEIFRKILKKNYEETNYIVFQPSTENLIQHELNAGHGVATNIEFQQVIGGINVVLTYQLPSISNEYTSENNEALVETFFMPTSDLQNVLGVILKALQGNEIDYPLTYTGKEFVKIQHDFRYPPDSSGGASGLIANNVHTDLVNPDQMKIQSKKDQLSLNRNFQENKIIETEFVVASKDFGDIVLRKKFPECFVSVDPHLKKTTNPDFTTFVSIFFCFGFLGSFLYYVFSYLKNQTKE